TGFDACINIQGDEPFIAPEQISAVANVLKNETATIATLVKKFSDYHDFLNPNMVKVVLDKNAHALYFSRAALPFIKNETAEKYFSENVFYKHIGIYGYNTETLLQLVKLPVSFLEKTESLEQLRWLENGFQIHVAITDTESFAVDLPEDIAKVESYFSAQH